MKRMGVLRRLIPLAALLVVADSLVWAHVGSPDVFYEGQAGPYHLFVTIRVPQVVPGIASIEVRSESPRVRQVRIVPLRLTGPGSKYPPTPDVAGHSRTDPQFFSGSLWLMEFGSLQVRILVDGDRGEGQLAVPVLAEAQRVLPMQRPLGVLLAALMALLAGAIISIAGAGSREAQLEPGAEPGARERHLGRTALGIAAAIVVAVLLAGNRWWNVEAARYTHNIYRNPDVAAALESGNRLILRSNDSKWVEQAKRQPLIPDHGHLVHVFLMRVPALDEFWHLHPGPTAPGTFAVDLPSVPAGRYQVFADIVYASGFPETLVSTIDLPEVVGRPLRGDDSATAAPPIRNSGGDTRVFDFPDGSGRMLWKAPVSLIKANTPAEFRFRVEDAGRQPVNDLEPYMGMAIHGEIVRSDCKVFAHVHPAGSVSMAALELAESGLRGSGAGIAASSEAGPGVGPEASFSENSMGGMAMPASSEPIGPEVSFPYGFPAAGTYRLFAQVKRKGKVETGVFDAHVE